MRGVVSPRAQPEVDRVKRADNSTLYAPPLTLGLQRIGRDSEVSCSDPLSYGRTLTLKQSGFTRSKGTGGSFPPELCPMLAPQGNPPTASCP